MRPKSRLWKEAPLFPHLMRTLNPLFVNIDGPSPIEPTTPQETYSLKIMERGFALLNSLDSLKHAVFYLGRYPSTPTYRNRGPAWADWVRYHVENYYIRYRGLHDRTTNLVAAVFVIAPKKNKDRPSFLDVIGDPKVEATGVRQRLQAIADKTSRHKEIRDGLTHQFSYSDEDLTWVEVQNMIEDGEIDLSIEDIWPRPWLSKQYVKEQVRTLGKLTDEIEEECEGLLGELESVYQEVLPEVRFEPGQ